jgi:hypothetical protein
MDSTSFSYPRVFHRNHLLHTSFSICKSLHSRDLEVELICQETEDAHGGCRTPIPPLEGLINEKSGKSGHIALETV